MASRTFTRTLKISLPRSLASPLAQRRSLVSAGRYVRAAATVPATSRGGSSLVFSRGMKTIDFAGHKETVYGKYKYELQL